MIESAMTKDEAIEEIVRRLIAYYQPERVYLFGSAARDEFGPDSDLDFCVVLSDDAPEQLFRSGAIYGELGNVGYPKDVVPWRRSDFDARAAHVVASLPATIIREGRLLYDCRTVNA
jgi:predicted nucleotidyltransferase